MRTTGGAGRNPVPEGLLPLLPKDRIPLSGGICPSVQHSCGSNRPPFESLRTNGRDFLRSCRGAEGVSKRRRRQVRPGVPVAPRRIPLRASRAGRILRDLRSATLDLPHPRVPSSFGSRLGPLPMEFRGPGGSRRRSPLPPGRPPWNPVQGEHPFPAAFLPGPLEGACPGAHPLPVKDHGPLDGHAFFDSFLIGLTSRRTGSIIPS